MFKYYIWMMVPNYLCFKNYPGYDLLSYHSKMHLFCKISTILIYIYNSWVCFIVFDFLELKNRSGMSPSHSLTVRPVEVGLLWNLEERNFLRLHGRVRLFAMVYWQCTMKLAPFLPSQCPISVYRSMEKVPVVFSRVRMKITAQSLCSTLKNSSVRRPASL